MRCVEGVVGVDERCGSSLRFDLYELDIKNSQLRRSGIQVDLPPQALRVLALLAARPNELVARRAIKDALWPGEPHGDFDSRLNFTVKKLREALGDDADRPRYVQTVRHAGYRFIAPVRPARDVSSANDDNPASHAAGIAQTPVERSAAVGGVVRHGFRFGLSGALLIAIIAVAASAVAFGGFVLGPRGAGPAVRAFRPQCHFFRKPDRSAWRSDPRTGFRAARAILSHRLAPSGGSG